MTQSNENLSEFLTYLAAIPSGSDQRIPPLQELSSQLGISVATLREQLEEARSMGVVEVKQRSGIRKLPYRFNASIKPGLTYAIASGSCSYQQLADLRRHLEAAYFTEAAQSLTAADTEYLASLVKKAQAKILEQPMRIPAAEHREFHLHIYKNLNNQYLGGMLQAFWDVYHQCGYEEYPDISYLDEVWQYHARIVNHLKTGNYPQALVLLIEHMDLLNQRNKAIPRLSFE